MAYGRGVVSRDRREAQEPGVACVEGLAPGAKEYLCIHEDRAWEGQWRSKGS